MTTETVETQDTFRDYYDALHIYPDADVTAIDQAYWRLARLYNNAIRSYPDATQSLDALNEAYRVLRSPELRREYDQVRNAVMDGDAPTVVLEPKPEPKLEAAPKSPPLAVMEKQRPKPRKERVSPSSDTSRLTIPQLDFSSWRTVAVACVILALTSVALVTGTEKALVLAILLGALGAAAYVVVVTLAHPEGRSLPVFDFSFIDRWTSSVDAPRSVRHETAAAPQRERKPARRSERPANLEGVIVPGGTSHAVRRLVYQMYAQWPHLGPADVHAVARYAALTERFTKGERRLRKLEKAAQEFTAQALAAEQRALASELRQHEVTLGITATARKAPKPTGQHSY